VKILVRLNTAILADYESGWLSEVRIQNLREADRNVPAHGRRIERAII
jgi:hypothetical protein